MVGGGWTWTDDECSSYAAPVPSAGVPGPESTRGELQIKFKHTVVNISNHVQEVKQTAQLTSRFGNELQQLEQVDSQKRLINLLLGLSTVNMWGGYRNRNGNRNRNKDISETTQEEQKLISIRYKYINLPNNPYLELAGLKKVRGK